MTDGTTLALSLAVLALLYLFLAAVVRVAWRDFAAAAPQRRGSVGRAQLLVLDGAARGPQPGDSIAIEGAASVGRDADNTIAIDDRTVSGRHAALIFDSGHWWVEDAGSTNGTYVNGARVESATALRNGDVLQIGRVTFRLAG